MASESLSKLNYWKVLLNVLTLVLRPILTVTTVLNTGETGNINGFEVYTISPIDYLLHSKTKGT